MPAAFKMCKDILFFRTFELWGVYLAVGGCLMRRLLCSFLSESVCEGTVKKWLT